MSSAGAALRLWSSARAIAGTPAGAYLAGRGLRSTRPSFASIRARPQGPKPLTRFRPALIAAVRDESGIVAVHRAFLDAPRRASRSIVARAAGWPVRARRGPPRRRRSPARPGRRHRDGLVRIRPVRPAVLGDARHRAVRPRRGSGLRDRAAVSFWTMTPAAAAPKSSRARDIRSHRLDRGPLSAARGRRLERRADGVGEAGGPESERKRVRDDPGRQCRSRGRRHPDGHLV